MDCSRALLLVVAILCLGRASVGEEEDRRADPLVDSFVTTTGLFLYYAPARERSLTDLADALRTLGEERVFPVLEAAYEVARERRDAWLAGRVTLLTRLLYGHRLDLARGLWGERLVRVDGHVLLVEPDSGGTAAPGPPIDSPPSSFVDPGEEFAPAPERKPLHLLQRLESRPGDARLKPVLECRSGRHSLATELGLAARRDPDVARGLVRVARAAPRPSAAAEVLDLALGLSDRETARELLAEHFLADLGSAADPDGMTVLRKTAAAFELGGGREEIVAALERVAKGSIDRALDLAGAIGGDAGREFAGAWAFAQPDAGRLARLGDVARRWFYPGTPDCHLSLVRRTLEVLESAPEEDAGLRAEAENALRALLFGDVTPEPAVFARELLDAVDDGSVELDRAGGSPWPAFGPGRVFQADPRRGRQGAEVRAKRKDDSVRVTVQNRGDRPLHVNRFALTRARSFRGSANGSPYLVLNLGCPYGLRISPAWIEVIEPGGVGTFDLPLPPAAAKCDLLRLGFGERDHFPSLTSEDALLSGFHVWCR